MSLATTESQPATSQSPHAFMHGTSTTAVQQTLPNQTLSSTNVPSQPLSTAAAAAAATGPDNMQPGQENAYPHQIHGLGGPTATAPFLQDFNLVAEAAKRAQMSVVMRDLESVTL